MTGVSLCSLPNRDSRDSILKTIGNRNLSCVDANQNKIDIAGAKTKRQITRNWAVGRAKDLLAKDAKTGGKEVKIEWKDPEAKFVRSIEVGGIRAFRQGADEITGKFLSPFEHLFIQQ